MTPGYTTWPCLLMALLSFYCSAELPLAVFPTQAQQYVDLRKNALKVVSLFGKEKLETCTCYIRNMSFSIFS